MGIHHWSKSAVLTLLVVLSIGHAHAATRKHVSMPSDGQVIGSGRGSSVSGDLLNVPGNPIEGEYIPSSYGGGSKGTKLPVQPEYQYVKSRTIKGMVGNLRGGVVGAGLTIGLSWMLEQVGGFIDENGQAMKPGDKTVDGQPIKDEFNKDPATICTIPAAQTIGGYYIYTYGGVQWSTTVVQHRSQLPSGYSISNNCTNESLGYKWQLNPDSTWPVAVKRQITSPGDIVYGGPVPLTEADYDLIEAAANAKDSEWLKERLREHCEGSLNPQACFDSLRNSTSLSGPSTVTEPGPTTTTSGPSGTTTSTTNTKIDITYGDNYYDYRTTKTTIVTKPDGSTETTTETEPETEQPREEEEQDINFTDSEFPPVEPFYQQKYPEGLEGVWQDAQSKFDNSEFMSFLHSFVPQFSGSCPSWSMSFNIASWASYGNVPFVNLCYVFDFIKVIMLVTALFTARAITFGG